MFFHTFFYAEFEMKMFLKERRSEYESAYALILRA